MVNLARFLPSVKWNPFHPPPAPPAFGDGKVVPDRKSGLLSQLLFQWLTPFLDVGYTRPLQKEDLWSLADDRLTHYLTGAVEDNFYQRCPPEKRPSFYLHTQSLSPNGSEKPDDHGNETKLDASSVEADQIAGASASGKAYDVEKGDGAPKPSKASKSPERKKKKAEKDQYDSSLLQAIHKTFFIRWWGCGLLKLLADTINTTSPLITKALLTWLTDSYYWHRLSVEQQQAVAAAGKTGIDGVTKPRGIGYGIGLAFGLFLMQEVSSLMTNHYMQLSMTIGIEIRTALIGAIFRKSLRLSSRARAIHSVGQITTMISADASRLDRVSAFAQNLWVSPIQITIGIALLIYNLGYSAVVGLGVLILGFPFQFIFVKMMFSQRKKGVRFTDTRVRLASEVLQGIRLIKYYAWESFYGHRLGILREREIDTIRKMAVARSALIAIVTFVPVCAAVLSFITYGLSGHNLNVGIIFSSLQYFNIIRTPLIFLPLVLAAVTDAVVAIRRIGTFLMAEELAGDAYTIDHDAEDAVSMNGDFTWETAGKLDMKQIEKEVAARADRKKAAKDDKETGKKKRKAKKGKGEEVLPTTGAGEKEDEDEKPFALTDVHFKVPKGKFVAVVGRVGSGKSSLLQAMVGEMRKTKGEIIFGGSVAYVPQIAWIQNATLRENIVFGLEEDEERFRSVVHACSLDHDLQLLPHGENTEIGEKGINLSGGQKARVSLARAAYSNSDIILLDDSLSAVDAYVGRSILDNCILDGPLAGKTRILVTHSLHVLDKTDHIFVMDNGVITEHGTYQELVIQSPTFKHIMEEYGNNDNIKEERKQGKDGEGKDAGQADEKDSASKGAELMQTEERLTGAVSTAVYAKYLRFAGGLVWAPIVLFLLTLYQGASVANNLFLGFWTAESIHGFTQGDYMAVYAALGVAQAIFAFTLSFGFAVVGLVASLRLFKAALKGILHSPVSFFDTTPIGRILSRFAKDQDTIDTEISLTAYQFLSTFSSVIGTVGLVFYTFPYLGLIFIPLSFLYIYVSSYYRRTSVETKRLDSLMRSALYSSYTETLTGLATVRAYRAQARSIKKANHGLDLENRAYFMTVSIQHWLSIRLDFFGNILVLGIGLFAVGFRTTVSPSKIGVVLSYTLSITQVFSQMIQQFAQNEQNMNAVERILVYTELPPEGHGPTEEEPPASWPDEGRITFTNVRMAYREGLPPVLKDVSFEVRPGEKVGIVGRTGAGKSSLLQVLFRMVELQGGKIEIDGQNIYDIRLGALRGRVALVPQDSTLFLGTLRENLDPQGTRTDAEILSALQRTWLLPQNGVSDPNAEAKFGLESKIGDEGSNYSVGEKQLLALCRALVKNSRIIVLDEATSSVDMETDSKIQRTIQTEFVSSTLLCIAHRLKTIAYYDRVLVMDAGEIAEFDTVLNLFDKEDSIFRSLCNEANLSREEILRLQADHALHD